MQENLEWSWRGMVTVEQGGIFLLLYNTALTYSVPDQLSVCVLLVNMQKTNHSFKTIFVDGIKISIVQLLANWLSETKGVVYTTQFSNNANFENILSSQYKLKKSQFVKTVTSCACVLLVRVPKSGIANFWPGIHNTAFLNVFADPCEQGSFWPHCHLYTKRFKNISIFSTSLSCK